MKLKSCFLLTIMLCTMLSCSKDDVPGEKLITPSTPDATLDLSTQTIVKTKALKDAVGQTWDYQVKTLTVAIFNAGAYSKNGVEDNKLVAVITQSYDQMAIDNEYELSGMGLQSGNVQVLAMANLPADLRMELQNSVKADVNSGRLTLMEVKQKSLSLENEKEENGLTMTAELGTVTLVSGKNCIGFGVKGNLIDDATEIYGPNVNLTRRIAAVQLTKLTVLDKKENNCKNIEVKQVFLANVKGSALIGGKGADSLTEGEAKVEFKDGALLAGAYADQVGTYKEFTGTSNPALNIDASNVTNLTQAIEPGKSWSGVAGPFFVYPNTANVNGNHTVLVVEATFNFNDDTPATTRFYAVPVNHPDFSGDKVSPLIRSNYKYNIELTVGLGSSKPYDKPVDAYISANIKVNAWDVIEIDQPVD